VTLTIEQLRGLPSPFYRVTFRALIFNDHQELLVFRNSEGFWELPGGGWEHTESIEQSISREVAEEIGATVDSIGDFVAVWSSKNEKYGYMQLRIGIRVKLRDYDFAPAGEATEVRFVDKQEFLKLPLEIWEAGAKEQADILWGENIRSTNGK